MRIEASIHPSPGAALALGALTALGLLAAFANGLPLAVQLSLAAAVVALGAHAIRRRLDPRTRGLILDGDQLRLLGATGHRTAHLTGRPFVSPLYIGLRFRDPRGRMPRTLGLFRDQMDADEFRRLSAALRQREQP